MNLVDQIFEQAKLGTAQNPDANPFAIGVQLGQHQQQINQQQQQLAMEIAQARLKQTLLQQDSAIKALSIEQLLKKRNDDIQNTKAFMGLQDAVNSRLEEGDLPEAINAFTQINTQTPDLWVDPRSQALGKQLDAMQKEADIAEYRNGMVQSRMMERDKGIREAARVGQLTAQLRESQAKTLEPDEGNPEYRAELTKQESIKAELAALQRNTAAVVPELKVIEGKKFLVNPKTGAVHEISKTIGKREFIAQHVASWVRDNPGMTSDEAATAMSEFYDKYLGEGGPSPAPGVSTGPSTGAKPSYRYNPASGRIEPVKP